MSHIGSRYGQCTIVFDGYNDRSSTKNNWNFWRNLWSTGSVISVQLDNSIGTVTQTSFLANPNNKECFIGLMAQILVGGGQDVIRCQEMLTLSLSQRFWTLLAQVAM